MNKLDEINPEDVDCVMMHPEDFETLLRIEDKAIKIPNSTALMYYGIKVYPSGIATKGQIVIVRKLNLPDLYETVSLYV